MSGVLESPSHRVAQLLLDLGAHVVAADPHVDDRGVDTRIARVELTPGEVDAADAVIVLVAHDVFDLPMVAERARYVFDTQRCLPGGPTVEHL